MGFQQQTNTIPTGLEKISENGNLGWRLIGRDPSLYGNIGQNAVDFSSSNVSDSSSSWPGDYEYRDLPGVQKGATGAYSAAFGMNTEALGEFSIASGNNSKASGASSFVIGKNNEASGDYSFVAGIDNKGTSLGSFVVGSNNEASGDDSFAGGYHSKVLNTGGFKSGSYSFAFGNGIEIDNPNAVSFGRFNLNDGSDNSGLYKSFTVGIGISDSDRRNAFEVYDGGGLEYGSIKAPYLQQSTIDADQTGKVLITREYFESKYNHAFDDAPIDGYVYGRKNKGWTRVAELAAVQVFFKGTLPPPSDFAIPGQPGRFFEPGDVYLHYSIPQFVTDGNINNVDGTAGYYDGNNAYGGGEKLWVLRDGSLETPARANYWSELKLSGGIEDAPIDNIKYVRKNKAWVPLGIQQIVYKGTEDPNTLTGFAKEGDKYLREASTSSGIDYSINLEIIRADAANTIYGYVVGANRPIGTVVSGTPDISAIYMGNIWSGNKISISFVDNNLVISSGFITINGFIFNIADATISDGANFAWDSTGSYYTWESANNPNVDPLYNAVAAGAPPNIAVHSEATGTVVPYMEYTKLSDGTWQSLNIEYLKEIPIDKLLENADITNATYDANGNILTATYGKFADKPAGYTSEYTYDLNNHPTLIAYKSESGVIVEKITITYDANGNMTSHIRS